MRLVSHLRPAIRLLLKSPGFTVTAVLVLALGIGANTAIFSLVNGVLLKPLPYPKPDRLVQIFQPFRNHETSHLDYPDFANYNAAQHTFETLTIFIDDDFNISGGRDPERVRGFFCSGTFFQVLGRPFLAGRPFGETDDKPDAPAVVVLSERLWRSRFNADPKIIGTNILLNSKSFQVIGVTPGQGDEGDKLDLYLPLSQDPDTTIKSRPGAHYFFCIGRLKDGVTLQEAQADFEVISQHLDSKYPATPGFGIRLVPYLDSVVANYSAMVWLLEGAVLCLLLITCANVANLLLARAQERRREITLRSALGASRSQLVQQLLAESLVLSVIGGIAGFIISIWSTQLIKQMVPPDISRFEEFGLDWTSFAFVLTATIFTALASGLFPAWATSRVDVTTALNAGGSRTGTAGPGRHRNQAVLVTTQIALTCLLLTGAGLLLRSFLALETSPLGFKTDHILTADLYLADSKYSTQATCKVFFKALLDKVRHLPGVTSVGLDDDLPFNGEKDLSFGVAGQPDPEPWKLPIWQTQVVSPDFFRTIGLPLLRGRFFDDREGGEKQVLVSERLAQAIFHGQDAIGKQLHDSNRIGLKENSYTIIGIVANIRHDSPGLERTPYQAYFLYSQDPFAPSPISFCTVLLRAEGDPFSLVNALKLSVAELDPNMPVSDISTFDQVVQQTYASRRLGMTIVSLFSVAALLLAAIGLYGVLAYSVSTRKREIGVRIALGAQPVKVVGLIMRQGLQIVAVGLAIGLAAGLMLAHLLDDMLYQVSATDPLSMALSVLVLGLSASVACLLPAFQATRIDPITALRE
jgi:putative ABC transport system permease protein